MNSNTIFFDNNIQRSLFKNELYGQISDGMWENARPYNHYQRICRANLEINPEKPGVNFYMVKNNYDFNSSFLIKCIGRRMMNICNLTEAGYSDDVISHFDEYDEENYEQAKAGKAGEYYTKRFEEFQAIFGTYENYKAILAKGSYDMKKLRKELKRIKEIIKTNIQ